MDNKQIQGYGINMRTICYMILFLTFPCQSVRADSIYESLTESDSDYWPTDLPANTIILEDISYGEFERQKFDVYIPENASSAPVIFLVHGGAWRLGNKSSNRLLNNKLGRWLPQGFIFISTNYRLLPDTDPLEQANDVALSLSTAQEKASSWGGDPEKFILMGHSAGGHLVSMLTAAPSRYYPMNVRPWLGSVILDSAA
ncbi:MAG: alpha/beta hydrolase, partial [Gammaproteobacteria bacterium]